MLFPKKLPQGGTVLLTALSSPLAEDQPVEEIARAVERLGLRARIGDACRAGPAASGYAAAPAALRAADLHRGFADPEIDAIWCVRGGSTSWQLLPLLDYDLIAAHPKPFIGFSDVTTLHLALQQRCGLVTFHGPTANRALDWAEDRFSWSSLRAALDLEDCLEIRNPPGAPVECLRPGRAEGILTGGNLSLAVHSLGTPEQIDARGRVLYLEDVGEAVYALEKMLTQLLRAGVLAAAAALVFGAFARCGNAYRPDYGPQALLRDFFAGWPCPVLAGLRSAHCSPMVTLPMGTLCQIDGDLGTITVRR